MKEPANFIGHWLLLKTMVHWASDIGELTFVYYAEFEIIFNSDVEPLSKYSPEMLHLPPANGIFNENLY